MNSCERDLREAKKRIKKLEKEVKKLRDLIDGIIAYCNTTAKANAREMGAGDVPRARYGWMAGQNETCNTLLAFLSQPMIVVRKRHKGALGMFENLFEDIFS